MRILIVDDLQVRHKRFQLIFGSPHRVDSVFDGFTAMVALGNINYDIVCLDHDLGNHTADGRDIANYLAANPHRCPARVLIHSHNRPAALEMREILNPFAQVNVLPFVG